MKQREQVFPLVAAVTKCLAVVASAAVGAFTLGVQAVAKPVVKIMDAARQVITPVAVNTAARSLVALQAPVGLKRRPVAVLVPPLGRMDIGQSDMVAMAATAGVAGFVTIVAAETAGHVRHMLRLGPLAGGDGAMTNGTVRFAAQVALVAKQDSPVRMGRRSGLIGIAVALTAVLLIFDIVTTLAHVHGGQISVFDQSAGLNISVAV